MIVTYSHNGHSAATAAGVVFYQLPRPAALAKLLEIDGITVAQANAMLDAPAAPEVWRATLMAAVANSTTGLDAEVGSILDREKAVALNSKIEAIMAVAVDLHSQQAKLIMLAEEAAEREAAARAAAEREAARVEAVRKQAAAQKAAATERTTKEEFDRRWAKAKVTQYPDDGTIVVMEPTHKPGIWNIVAKYAPGADVPPHILARLKK